MRKILKNKLPDFYLKKSGNSSVTIMKKVLDKHVPMLILKKPLHISSEEFNETLKNIKITLK